MEALKFFVISSLLLLAACSKDKPGCKANGEIEVTLEERFNKDKASVNDYSPANDRYGFMTITAYGGGSFSENMPVDSLGPVQIGQRGSDRYLLADGQPLKLEASMDPFYAKTSVAPLSQQYRLKGQYLDNLRVQSDKSFSAEVNTQICSSSLKGYVFEDSGDKDVAVQFFYKAKIQVRE